MTISKRLEIQPNEHNYLWQKIAQSRFKDLILNCEQSLWLKLGNQLNQVDYILTVIPIKNDIVKYMDYSLDVKYD